MMTPEASAALPATDRQTHKTLNTHHETRKREPNQPRERDKEERMVRVTNGKYDIAFPSIVATYDVRVDMHARQCIDGMSLKYEFCMRTICAHAP